MAVGTNGIANGRAAETFAAIDHAGLAFPTSIVKRDGRVVPFDIERIENALSRCFASLSRTPQTPIEELARRVVNLVAAKAKGATPSVEGVQDIVEMVLQGAGEFEAAKHYILYRAEHAKQRVERPIPEKIRQAFAESDRYFPTALQRFQFFDKYSRFNYELGRRETWIETVDRSVSFLHELAGDRLPAATYERVRRAILEMRAMPSMRLLAMAGPAARRNNITIYNCSYQPVDSIDSFVEALIISMSGCGVGFSVEGRYVENFPRIKRQTGAAPKFMVVEDSAEGWADALRAGLETWFEGGDIRFDLSLLRPAGAPLKTKGGRASGPEPLRVMLDFVRSRILARQGSFLRPLDAHDMMCAVGNAAVSGGVRRCLPKGSRVHTERGAVPIEEVREGDRVMTASGYKTVTGWVDQGVQAVVEIITESGTIFRCTPHHRVAVLTDVWGGHTFKYARDLTPEDRLLFITHPIDGEAQPLLPLPEKREADHSGSQIRQPVLNTETAWFLGKFFADGYVQITEHDERGKGGNTQFAVACHTSEIDQIERISAWMEDHGITARMVYQDGKWVQIRSGNRQIARWMSQYKQPNKPLTVPEAIWRSPADVRAAFIAGLMDGDGCYTDRPVTIVSTVYEGFSREVVKLLATLGIIAETRVRRPETEEGWKAQWIVTVKDAIALQQAAAIIGAHGCGIWVPRKGKQAGYTVPGWMVKRDLPRKDYVNLWASSRDENMNSATLTTLVDATHYVPVGIVEVRPGGDEHTFDIEVRDGSMFVAEGYLVHNTAMISLFDYDDDEMRLSKNGDFERDNSQRWNANNSAIWPAGGLTQQNFIRQFMEMVESGRGEPGIFNREAALNMRPERRQPAPFGTNPCVTADTWVHTEFGPTQVGALVGQPFVALVDGRRWASTEAGFWLTGTKPVYEITTEEGFTLRATADHPIRQVTYQSRKARREAWTPAGDLRSGDLIRLNNQRGATWEAADHGPSVAWLLGSLVGDGTFAAHSHKSDQAIVRFWGESAQAMAQLAHAYVSREVGARSDLAPVYNQANGFWQVASTRLAAVAAHYGITPGSKTITPQVEATSSAFYTGFLRGLFDADGSVIGGQEQGVSVRLSQSSLALLQAAQRMLLRLGVASAIYENRREAQHELVISNDNIQEFALRVGFAQPAKAARLGELVAAYRRTPNRERFTARVASVTYVGEAPVYDCSIPGINAFDANGLYVHNCGEIVLRPWQFCNLTAAVARHDDTVETLREKVEVATIIGTIQSMAVHFPGLRSQWRQNCEEERLLGVDITGQLDSPIAQDAGVKAQMRQIATELNRELAGSLGINPSAAITCVKPSGNSSQLINCSSGLHARWAPYYVRNVRVAAHSPIYKVLRDAGVPMDPENGQTPENATTWVVHFPVKSPEGAITRKDRSAIQQCEFWLQNKLFWTDHNPSCFSGDTRFITDQGLRRFDEYADGTPVVVMNARGGWAEATVRAHGEQEIWEVEVERCGVRHSIRTTANHLWPVSNPMRRFQGHKPRLLRTDQLDRIVGSSEWKLQTVNPTERPGLDLDGALHGITFGDGTRRKLPEGRNGPCQVYLCNDPNGVDSRQLTELFEEAGYKTIDRQDCEQVRIYALPKEWKSLPSPDASPEYLRAFVAGWFAADGHIDVRGSQSIISSVNRAALEWLQVIAPRAGLAVSTQIVEHHGTSSAFGPIHSYTLGLVKESLDEDFFLLEEKRARFTAPKFAKHWKVVAVRPTGQSEPVFCVEEPGEHLFVLEGNILTHNCTITYRPDEVIDLMKWVWEHRDQIGGLSFLPAFDAKYDNMPYVEIAQEEYERLAAVFPEIDFSKVYRYEEEDLTNAAQELACSSGICEIDL